MFVADPTFSVVSAEPLGDRRRRQKYRTLAQAAQYSS
jgi:hypothetical protein